MKAIEISNILAFLRGELPEEKQKKIQEKITQDPAYAKEVAAYRLIMDGFQNIRERDQQLYAFKTMEIDLLADGEAKEMLEQDLIEAHLAGLLDKPALTWFEERLVKDEAFKMQVADYKLLGAGFEGIKSKETRGMFEGWEQELREEEQVKTPSIIPKSSSIPMMNPFLKKIAAIFVGGLLCVGLVYQFSKDNHSFKSYKLFNSERSDNNQYDENLKMNEDSLYRLMTIHQDYSNAKKYLNSSAFSDSTFNYIYKNYHKGYIALELEDYNTAKIHFQNVKNSFNNYSLDQFILEESEEYLKQIENIKLKPFTNSSNN